MALAVRADAEQKEEFLLKKIPKEVQIIWVQKEEALHAFEADVYFDFLFGDNLCQSIENKPVFVNAVVITAKELPHNYIRINGWNGFLSRDIIEFATCNGDAEKNAEETFEKLGWRCIKVPDISGMISARIICTIINEAYFAFGEGVSTKDEIDTAMKLGTNYPFGPFEWSEKIGLKKVYGLLKKLSEEDESYVIAPKLKEQALQMK